MKVYIGPYQNHFGTFQLAEKLCFWVKKVPDEYGIMRNPEWVHDFGEWLTYGSVEPEPEVGDRRKMFKERKATWLCRLLHWINDKRPDRKIEIRIDKYDTWGMDHTLALIILPMLKQLKATKHGAPFVEDTDVPDHLRSDVAPSKENEWDTDGNHFLRWDWVLDEMIFAFTCIVDDSWQDEFSSGDFDNELVKLENGMYQMEHGPNHTYKCDYAGMKKVEERIANGTRLFGKYYQGLWD